MQTIDTISDVISDSTKRVANHESAELMDDRIAHNEKAVKDCDILIEEVMYGLEEIVSGIIAKRATAENEGKKDGVFKDGIVDLDEKMIDIQVLAEVLQYLSARNAALE